MESMGDQKPCHNCRKRRLRCDRSVPACYKCTRTGQRCLGYGKLYRWVHSETPGFTRSQSPGSALIAFSESSSSFHPKGHNVIRSRGDSTLNGMGHDPQGKLNAPVDPLLQDLTASSRYYMSYFASRFCQDLVVHDSLDLGTNPFRGLIPMSQAYPYLQHIIIAVSAIHYYRAIRNATSGIAELPRYAQSALVDALRARQNAIREMIAVIKKIHPAHHRVESQEDKEALLATILFFVNFTLIDSGKDGWKNHLAAAEKLLSVHTHPNSPVSLLLRAGDDDSADDDPSSSTLSLTFPSASAISESSRVANRAPSACDYIASDTVAYSIWNCALESLLSGSPPSTANGSSHSFQCSTWDVAEVSRILSRTEDNSYHSCPAHLMGIILQTARITQFIKASGNRTPDPAQMDLYLALLKDAETFDVKKWAAGVSTQLTGVLGAVNEQERNLRCHIAATYRAAVCLYILLVAHGLSAEVRRRAQSGQDLSSLPTLQTTEDLSSKIFDELSFIPKTNPLFKYTVWPVFLTGVDAVSKARRIWVIERLRAMQAVCPWGMISSAMETLTKIWKLRDSVATSNADVAANAKQTEEDGSDWLSRLQGLRIDCLIV